MQDDQHPGTVRDSQVTVEEGNDVSSTNKMPLSVEEEESVSNHDATRAAKDLSQPSRFPKLAVAVSIVSVVGLIVGLSVGLTRRKDLPSYPTFNSTLRPIGPEVLDPYPSCVALRSDLVKATKSLVNSMIDAEARAFYGHDWNNYGCGRRCSIERGPEEVAMADSSSSQNQPNGQPPDSGSGGETSFLTNNQVKGVDEADIIKANANFIFAAYGTDIVVLSNDTTLLHRFTLPSVTPTLVVNNETISTESRSSVVEEDHGYECSSSIAGLLLFEDRLSVVVSAYCYFWGPFPEGASRKVLSDSQGTRTYIYDVSEDDGSLKLVDSVSIHGYYISARSIGPNAHVVTTSYVNPYDQLTQYINPWSNPAFDGLLENEYRTAAHVEAERHVDDFVDAVVEDLLVVTREETESASCGALVRLSLLQASDASSDKSATTQLDFTGNGVLSTFTLVSSFDMQKNEMDVSTSGIFLPTSTNTIYSSKQQLVIAGQGWYENLDRQWHEETWLISYLLDGASSRAVSLGHVPGYTLNQFSIDHTRKDSKDYLRVATTTSAQWGMALSGRWEEVAESRSQVTVLELPTEDSENRLMTKVGQVTDLGPTERIYSVRFIGDRGYVVTFRQVDPFYTLDLSVAADPKLVGILKIPGFSNQLQPISDDLILGVGQYASEDGVVRGFQVSLFDVSNFSDPRRIHQHVIKEGWSSSSAQYEHKAIRYLEQSQLLILPVEVYLNWDSDENFDGFYVYNISASDGIHPRFTIEHADADSIRNGCWSSSYLDARSVVYNNVITTFKGHSILGHNLTSAKKVIGLNLDEDIKDCHWGYFKD